MLQTCSVNKTFLPFDESIEKILQEVSSGEVQRPVSRLPVYVLPVSTVLFRGRSVRTVTVVTGNTENTPIKETRSLKTVKITTGLNGNKTIGYTSSVIVTKVNFLEP